MTFIPLPIMTSVPYYRTEQGEAYRNPSMARSCSFSISSGSGSSSMYHSLSPTNDSLLPVVSDRPSFEFVKLGNAIRGRNE